MKKSSSLSGALTLILGCALLCVVVTVMAGIFTGEWLYYVAALLFAISGIVGVVVVRSLSAKING